MKTMYRLEEERWLEDPLNGGHKEWRVVTEWFFTCAEAEAKAKQNVTWRIIARTIDEKAFTVEDKTVRDFDYDLQVAFRLTVKERIANCEAELEKLERSRERTKSEARAKMLDKQIAGFKKSIEENKNLLKTLDKRAKM